MKTAFKYSLFRLGLFGSLDLLRRMPEVARWLRSGCRAGAPPPVKRMAISAYMSEYRLRYFVETGTHVGDTLAQVAMDNTIQATSIEVDASYFKAAQQRFRNYTNVTLLHGDSGVLMPTVVSRLEEPALFWLDGHYSGGPTGRGDLDTPVAAEIEAILDSPLNGHVILIDDAHQFDGTCDYPHLDQLIGRLRLDGRYAIEVSAGMVRATPKRLAP